MMSALASSSPSRRRVTLGALLQIVVRLIGLVAGAVVAAVQARTLSVAEFGVFSTILLLCGIAQALSDLGLTNVTVKRIAIDPDSAPFHAAALLQARLAIGCVTSLLAFGLSVLLLGQFGDVLAAALVLASVPIGTVGTLQAVPIAKLELGVQNILLLVQSATWLIIVLVLGALSADLLQFAIGFFAASVIQALVVWRLVARRVKPQFRSGFRHLINLMSESLPLGIGGLGVTAYFRVGGIVLFSTWGAEQAAYLSGATRVLEVAQAIPASILGPLLPLLSASLTAQNKAKAKAVWAFAERLVAASSLMVVAGVVALAPDVIRVLYGDRYEQTILVLRVLIFSFVPICIGWLTTSAIIASGAYRAYATVTLVTAAFSVVAAMLVIPVWGAIGTAFVTLGTESVVAAALLAVARRRSGLVSQMSVWLRSVAAAALTGGALVLIPGFGEPIVDLLVKTAIGVVVGAILLLAMRVVTYAHISSALHRREV